MVGERCKIAWNTICIMQLMKTTLVETSYLLNFAPKYKQLDYTAQCSTKTKSKILCNLVLSFLNNNA